MRFQLVAAFVAMASAVALPTTNDAENPTIGHAQNVCGSFNKQLNCCSEEQEIVGLGLLSNLLGGLGLFNGCSSLSVTARALTSFPIHRFHLEYPHANII